MKSKQMLSVCGAAVLVTLLVPATLRAQTPNTITMCYTPLGVVYLIKEEGLRDSCLLRLHKEISWASITANADGNVGIGTDNPTVELEVNGTIGAHAFAGVSPLIFEAPAKRERMRIDETTGYVGIGTAAPAAQLDVAGTGDVGVRGSATGSANGIGVVGDGNSVGVKGNTSRTDDFTAGGKFENFAASGINFGVEGIAHSQQGVGLRGLATSASGGTGLQGISAATSGGSIGVYGAVSSPGGQAGVFQTTSTQGKVLSGRSGAGAGTEVFTVLGNGKVGVGTTTPSELLTVAGTIESTVGGFKFPDGSVQNTAATSGGGVAGDLDCMGCVETGDLADGAVTSVKIGPGAINGSKLAPQSVELSHIANGAVRENHIWPGAVSTNALASNAVTGAKIDDEAVTSAKMAEGAVRSAQVQDGSLTTDDIGVSSGSVSQVFDILLIGKCDTRSFSPPGLDANDVVVVTRGSELPSSAATMAIQRDGPNSYEIRMCNTTGGNLVTGLLTFHYVVFEVPN
jgi:hypothetical protein